MNPQEKAVLSANQIGYYINTVYIDLEVEEK